MPETATLELTIPAELGDHDSICNQLRQTVAAVEQRYAEERRLTGKPVVGRRNIRRQSWRACPTSREPRRTLCPRIAARSIWSRAEALARDRAFLDAYRAARAAWLAGTPTLFPRGTYWLARYAHVAVEPLAA